MPDLSPGVEGLTLEALQGLGGGVDPKVLELSMAAVAASDEFTIASPRAYIAVYGGAIADGVTASLVFTGNGVGRTIASTTFTGGNAFFDQAVINLALGFVGHNVWKIQTGVGVTATIKVYTS